MKCEYIVCAVVFGVNKSILKLELTDGYKFVTKSLNPNIDELDKIFDLTDMGLRREYEAARIDENNLDVICIYKEFEKECSKENADKKFREVVNDVIRLIDNQIRIIRLVNEGNSRVKRIAVRMKCDDGGHNCIIPIGESYMTTSDMKVNITEDSAAITNDYLQSVKLPFDEENLTVCHIMYDMSYHCEDFIATVVLVDMLEAMFLTEDDDSSKKIPLAKRCALYLEEDGLAVNEIYNNLLDLYERRNAIIHEGKLFIVGLTDVKVLRSYCRRTIIKKMNDEMNKEEMVKLLMKRSQGFAWEEW